jgi:hypothetical protein
MTSELLADYEEGTWTPVDGSGAGLSFTVSYARYTLIGRLVHYEFAVTYPVTVNGANATISGLPFNAANNTFGKINYSDAPLATATYLSGSGANIFILNPGINVTNAAVSGKLFIISGLYSI